MAVLPQNLINTKEACDVLGIKTSQFYSLYKRHLKTYKMPDNNKNIYFEKSEVINVFEKVQLQITKERINKVKTKNT